MKNNKGFTLIELLAVILILGIIALIAIPTVSSVVEQSRTGAKESTGTELVKAAEQYIMKLELDNDKIPSTCGDDGDEKCKLEDITSGGDLSLLKGVNSDADLAKVFDVKGDLPKLVEITKFTTDGSGNVILTFVQDNYTCTNSGQEKGNVKCSKNNG